MKKVNLTKLNNEKSALQEQEMDKIRAGFRRRGHWENVYQTRMACLCGGNWSFFSKYFNYLNDII